MSDLARTFHETYERLAPSFGYETRPDTKAFDPESPNGRLMTAVCEEVAGKEIAALRQQLAALADKGTLQALRDANDRAERAEQQLAEARERAERTCAWSPEDPDYTEDYQTECGHMFQFTCDPPHDWLKFCCYCGKKVVFVACGAEEA